MAEIKIKYEEVYKKTLELKSYISGDLMVMIENEYNAIQSSLDDVDRSTNAKLKESMEASKQKSLFVSKTSDKLLSFMSNSSAQLEENESKMSDAIIKGTKTVASGMKKTSGGVK